MSEIKWRVIGGDSLCVVIDGKDYVIRQEHPNFRLVAVALLSGEHDKVREFVTIETAVQAYLETTGVEVKDGKVTWNGQEINSLLTDRILEAITEGIDPQPFIKFLNNLMQNPSKTAQEGLFNFVEKCGLTITPDGCFLGYKKVREDYMDVHSGRFSNKIGQTISMLRENVVEDPNVACASGLHVGTFENANMHFSPGSGHVMIVSVNPIHVVSVPYDYDYQKMRTCEYTVVGEYTRKLHEAVCDEYSDEKVERLGATADLDLVNYDTEVDEECCSECGECYDDCCCDCDCDDCNGYE